MDSSSTIVVIGGGLAGAKAVEALRDKGFDGPLVLLAAERRLPYERPPLSKDFLIKGEGLDEATVHSSDWYAEHQVDLRLGERATELDPARHIITTSSGAELSYAKALLATGAQPRRLDVAGAGLDGVLSLRTVADSERLRDAFVRDARVVIVGGGWIGLETAAAAQQAGSQVTVLEPLDLPLVRVLGPRLATVFADLHREHGIDLKTGVTVSGFEGDGSVSGVRLESGEVVPADVVVVGVGAVPDTELAESAGLEVDGGVRTDEHGQTSDPDVFAVGDVARYRHPSYPDPIRVEHWAEALNHPAAVAAAMLGQDATYDELPYFFTDQYDLGMEYIGLGSADDDVVIRGDEKGREFIAFWLRDDRVVAGMNVNVWDVVDDVKALIRAGKTVDRARLADPDVPLDQVTAG